MGGDIIDGKWVVLLEMERVLLEERVSGVTTGMGRWCYYRNG